MRTILLALLLANTLWGAYIRDNATQTVYDSNTSLTWQDDGNASSQYLDWSNAINYCEALNFAGVDDWRLPNSNELLSIVDNTRINPAIDSTFQNVTSNLYWSSTTYAGDSSYAWYVYFFVGDGVTRDKSVSFYVRCVRGGQLVTSSPIQEQVISIKEGWQLLGATQDINATSFDNKCVDFVWKYSNGWSVHVANEQNISIPSSINTLTAIQAGEGFWVKGNGTCPVDSNDTATPGGSGSLTSGFTADMIVGKTLYLVDEVRYEMFSLSFGSNYKITTPDNEVVDYQIINGVITIVDSYGSTSFSLTSSQTGYYNGTMQSSQTSEDVSSQLGTSTIASFNNDIIKLRDYFLAHGLWETTITANGVVNRYDTSKQTVNGRWWIENNKFYFLYPDSDTGGLDDKAYWLDNGKLMFATDSGMVKNIRLYEDQTVATVYFNALPK